MGSLTWYPDSPFTLGHWQADVAQRLEEHHLVAFSDSPRRRAHFAVSLSQFLQGLRDTEVVVLYGQCITGLDALCYQLERAIPGPGLDRRIDGPRGVTALLRSRQVFYGRPPSKFRYYVWHDADTLLARDETLFAQVVDAIAGVAAEAEYVSDDLLMIHRAVFVGSSALARYAGRPDGQFRCWLPDPAGSEPFWQIVTGLERPPVQCCRIETLMR